MSTAAIARHHADWRRLLDISGPFLTLPVLARALPQGLDPHSPEILQRTRLAYDEWREAPGDPEIHRLWIDFVLRDVLGHPDEVLASGQSLPPGLSVTAAEHHEVLKPDLAIVNPQGRPAAGAARVLVGIVPAGTDLDRPLPKARWKETPAGRMAVLLRGCNVRLGLLTNGEDWMLVDAPREGTAGFTRWRAWLWLEEHDTLRAFRTLLGPERLFNQPENGTLEALLAESAEKQQEVTDQLGRQVRRAVEILVRAIDHADREAKGTLLAGTPEREVYQAAVTFMMRLVFLFCAEEQGLFPLDQEEYANSYAASTLREQLREAAEQGGEEVLERRASAWPRLLATFRAVHGGLRHEDVSLPPYGGHLFDPDRFPFLEGRARGSRWREERAQPLPINDRTVLHLLDALQLLYDPKTKEAQRLSFRQLDIEQIGHVYEGLLDHTVRRAEQPHVSLKGPVSEEPEVALGDLEEWLRRGKEAFVAQVRELTGRSEKAVLNDLAAGLAAEEEPRFRIACDQSAELLYRVRPFAGLVRDDDLDRPVVIPAGALFVTQGSDRRSTGTHYTPRSLTEPIVQHTLESLVYEGPADGKPAEEWRLRPANELLGLKVCDMACGSGAFLVQACRYLSIRLVEAWAEAEARNPGQVVVTPEGQLSHARPSECLIPTDAAEREALARRLVADRCLYGVDVNPMAVEMAKLSLWLITLQKDRAFTFLDHAIKCGDSLLGITELRQLEVFDLSPGEKVFERPRLRQALAEAREIRERLERRTVIDIQDAEEKESLFQQASALAESLRLAADVLVGIALASTSSRRKQDGKGPSEFRAYVGKVESETWAAVERWGEPGLDTETIRSTARTLVDAPNYPGRRSFHWPLEFPEVLGAKQGFHAFIGNPPFQGGQRITGALGTDYRDYLVEHLAEGRRGSADLCAYFFLRAASLMRAHGGAGLLATNTIAQGDTREVGLQALTARGFSIPRAVPSRKWPGQANLEVAHVWFREGDWKGPHVLEEREVQGIGPFLGVPARVTGKPYRLAANAGKSFQGSIVLGMGFVLTPDEAAELIDRDPRNKDVLFPYLNGEDLNSRPDQSASRWVINFRDWPLDRSTAPAGHSSPVAADYPDCLAIVREKVKPERDSNKRAPRRERWWQYAERASALYTAITALDRVLAISLVTQHVAVPFVVTGQVYAHKLAVFPLDADADFALLQSTPHEVWAREYSSSLETRLNYSPSDCFETFPLPPRTPDASERGRRLDAHRRELMSKSTIGLTKTYGMYHDVAERSPEVVRLRDLHAEVDDAVLAAYGWGDLSLDHGFHETKQGVRFTVSAGVRRELLNRLLELNFERFEEEVQAGLHDAGHAKRKRVRGDAGQPAAPAQLALGVGGDDPQAR